MMTLAAVLLSLRPDGIPVASAFRRQSTIDRTCFRRSSTIIHHTILSLSQLVRISYPSTLYARNAEWCRAREPSRSLSDPNMCIFVTSWALTFGFSYLAVAAMKNGRADFTVGFLRLSVALVIASLRKLLIGPPGLASA